MKNLNDSAVFAVVEIKGKQYKVFPNDTILIDRSELKPGERISFEDSIFLVGSKKSTLIGTPTLDNIRIDCTILKQVVGSKVISLHKRRRKNSRTFKYVKPLYTLVKIDNIMINNNINL